MINSLELSQNICGGLIVVLKWVFAINRNQDGSEIARLWFESFSSH